MDAEYQKLVQQVKDAVNNQGPDGGVISGSEEPVRDAMGRLQRTVYEKAIQLRKEASQAASSPWEEQKDRTVEEWREWIKVEGGRISEIRSINARK